MTRSDIEHLSQVLISIHALIPSQIPQEEFDRLVDRMLWAIHASRNNPKFDEQRFRAHANNGPDPVFPNK